MNLLVNGSTLEAAKALQPKPPLHRHLLNCLGIVQRSGLQAPTISELEQIYRRPPSFLKYMPYRRYDPESGCFLFRDNVSTGALFELRPIDAQSRPEDMIEEFADKVATAISSIPQRVDKPWVVQFYLQDEPLTALELTLDQYMQQFGEETPFREHYREIMRQHFELIARPGGMFEDTLAGVRWGGKYRRIRVTLYREQKGETWPNALGQMPWDEVNDVARRLAAGLDAAGMAVRRANGRDLFEWLLPWFTPKPAGFKDAYDLLRALRYPSDEEVKSRVPVNFDLASFCNQAYPQSSPPRDGIWEFGGLSHRIVCFDFMNRHPKPGHFTLSGHQGKHKAALFDKLPPGAIYTLTVVIHPHDHVIGEIEHLQEKATGTADQEEALESVDTAKLALRGLARGHDLHKMFGGVFLRAADREQLALYTTNTIAALSAADIPVVDPTPGKDLVGLEAYAYALPFAYTPKVDKQVRRTQYAWLENIACLAPIYGYSTGTGKPGFVYYNGLGEPMMFDPLNPDDRERVGHSLIFGASGAGKSAIMNYKVYQAMAVHKPYLYIIDVGDSYRLMGEHFKRMGLSTHYVRFTADANLSIPPFAEAATWLDREQAGELEGGEDERRDYLTEMETAATIMLTGADPNKELSRVRSSILRHAIKLMAMRKQPIKDKYQRQAMVDDLIDALRSLGEGEPIPGSDRPLQSDLKLDAATMAEEISFFATGLEARFFNRPADTWPDVDVTIIDLGILGTSDSYRASLAVTFAGLMNYLNTVIESRRMSGRPTVVAMDEIHVSTELPLNVALLVKAIKMWRRWGGNLWLATQNVGDFHDDAAKILSNCEYWYLMGLTKAEIDEIDQRFRRLTDEERSLLVSARKEPGKFVEGVLLKEREAKLFRNVPPSLVLALAKSGPEEKAERAQLMEAHGITELEAAYRVAESIHQQRLQV